MTCRLVLLLLCLCAVLAAAPGHAQPAPSAFGDPAPAEPDAALAARIFAAPGPLALTRIDTSPPGWEVSGPAGIVGHIGSTWEIAGSIGYSGRPIDILVGVSPDARIAGAELMQHNEPVLTLGISDADIAAYVGSFAGLDLTQEQVTAFGTRSDLPDIIARATVSTGVIRDAILRTARTLALGRGLVGGAGAGIDRVAFAPATWADLAAEGALTNVTIEMDEARRALDGASVPSAGRVATSSNSGPASSIRRPSGATCSASRTTPARSAPSAPTTPHSSSPRAACTRTAAPPGAARTSSTASR